MTEEVQRDTQMPSVLDLSLSASCSLASGGPRLSVAPFLGCSDLRCIDIKVLVKQITWCTRERDDSGRIGHHSCRAKLFLLIRSGQEKNALFSKPRSGLGFSAAAQTWTVKLTMHGPLTKADTASLEAFP